MNKDKNEGFVFRKENYRLLLAGVVLIFLGYLLMIGGASENPYDFSPEIFSPRRITVAPIVSLSGFILIVWAIMKKPKA